MGSTFVDGTLLWMGHVVHCQTLSLSNGTKQNNALNCLAMQSRQSDPKTAKIVGCLLLFDSADANAKVELWLICSLARQCRGANLVFSETKFDLVR